MFEQKMTLRIKDREAIDFCKVLGKYGVKFDITDANETELCHYKNFTIRATNSKIREMYGEFSMIRDGQFKSYNDEESA